MTNEEVEELQATVDAIGILLKNLEAQLEGIAETFEGLLHRPYKQMTVSDKIRFANMVLKFANDL